MRNFSYLCKLKKKHTDIDRMVMESHFWDSLERESSPLLSDMERQDYETRIAQLNETIRQNNELVNRLIDQLKEQGQKTDKAEQKVEKLERRIEELLDEIMQLNKRIKDLIDRDKCHRKMSMGKKSLNKRNGRRKIFCNNIWLV